MSFRMHCVCSGWLLLGGYSVTAIAQKSRPLTFAEKVAPVVKKQLAINYLQDTATQERLWNSWKSANGLKDLAEDEGGRILEQKKSAPPQTRQELERQLRRKVDQIEKLDEERRKLLREADALLLEVTSPFRPKPSETPQLPDDKDMASVFTNSGLGRVRVELHRGDALRFLERWDAALGANPRKHSPEEVLEVLGQIDGVRENSNGDVAPNGGTDVFQILKQLRTVELQIQEHNNHLANVRPPEVEAYNAEANSLNQQMGEMLANIDEDTARVFFARPSEPEVNAASDRLRQLMNKRSKSVFNNDGQICPDPPPPVKPPKLLN